VTSLEAYRREEFPITAEWAYFNHASTGPMPQRSARAMQDLAEGQMLRGGLDYRRWIDAVAGLRDAAARLIHAAPEEIAVISNTSQGISFIANGVRWNPGDIVVGVADEFPANYFPWARLEARGVRLRWVPLQHGCVELDELDRSCEGARLLAVSYVQYFSGFRVDLDAVGEICRRRGCRLVVDSIQGLGPFAIDVKRSGIHALSNGGQKWLLGPEGSGFLYVDRNWLPELDIVEFGWTNVAGFPAYSKDPTLRPDAGRFEGGTLNGFGCAGLRASIELLLEVGVERLSEQVHTLAERLLEGAQAKGYQACAARERASGSGIVSICKEGVDAAALAKRLLEEKIVVVPRHGYLRVAPHFYNTAREIDRLVELLP
jgi:selenocysteine lyase/cysteine desulfurase